MGESCSLDESRALAKIKMGEMISSKEMRIRTVIGYALCLTSIAINAYNYHLGTPHGVLLGALCASSGIMLYKMGTDSQ